MWWCDPPVAVNPKVTTHLFFILIYMHGSFVMLGEPYVTPSFYFVCVVCESYIYLI